MRIVVVTGGIGSGKSAFCHHLALKGIPVYDCDSRAKSLYSDHPELIDKIEKELGFVLKTASGAINKKLIADIIFSDKIALEKVESIVHPAVFHDFIDWCADKERKGYDTVIMESAVPFDRPFFLEVKAYKVLIVSNQDLRIKRVMQRDGASSIDVLKRIENQYFDKNKADFVIENNDKLEDLFNKADEFYEHLKDIKI